MKKINLKKGFALACRRRDGFTLIELLVVVAIIGLLLSVILASLNTSRNKSKDAKVKTQLNGMRAQADLYTGQGTAVIQGTTCVITANSVFDTANKGIGNLFAGLTLTGTRCGSALKVNGGAWAVAFPLLTGGVWCVDSATHASNKTKATGAAYSDLNSAITSGATGTTCL